MGKVQLIGFWRSPFSWRVEIILKLKGIDYEFVEENLQELKTRSELVLKHNPVHKKIPILVHDGKAIAESLVIMEYIDETWKDVPLLPSDPYERAQARFWAKFIDDKIFIAARDALFTPGTNNEKAKAELHDLLKILENEIKGKKYLGGNDVGYLDIVAFLILYWVPVFQEAVGKEVLPIDQFPGIFNWFDELLDTQTFLKENLPPRDVIVPSFRAKFAKILASTQ